MDWHQTKPENLTTEQRQQKYIDYYNTFYANVVGRKVLCDLKNFIEIATIDTPEMALAKLALLRFYDYIRESCGITDQFAVIEVEAIVAASHKVEKPTEEKKITIYDIEGENIK